MIEKKKTSKAAKKEAEKAVDPRHKKVVICDIDGTVTAPWYGIRGDYQPPPPHRSGETRHKLFRQDLMDGIELALALGFEIQFITNGVGGYECTQTRIEEMSRRNPRVSVRCFSSYEQRLAFVKSLVFDPEAKDVRYIGDSLQDIRAMKEIFEASENLPFLPFTGILIAEDNSLFATLAYDWLDDKGVRLIPRSREPISEALSRCRLKPEEPLLETIKKALEDSWKTST